MLEPTEITASDCEDVLSFWQNMPGVGLSGGDTPEGLAVYLRRNPGLSLVVRDEGRIVGAVLCGHDGRRGYLHHLAVSPRYRKQGLGNILVERCLSKLGSEGIPKCNIFVYADNNDGSNFWKRNGWLDRADLQVMQRPVPVAEQVVEKPQTKSPKSMNQWEPTLYEEKHSFVWKLGSSLVDLLAPQPGERILDLGCGIGQLTAQIAESGADVVGMDQSPTMIEEARCQHPQIRFDVDDAQNFEYAKPFDAVFSNAVLHWIKEPEKVVRSISQALKPNGRMVVEFGGKGNVRQLAQAAEMASRLILGHTISHPWYFPSISEFTHLLESAGFEVTQALLFDRPTPLEGEEGLRNWLRMFGTHWLNQVPEAQQEAFLRQVEDLAQSHLFQDGTWSADYRRLRVVAHKRPEEMAHE